MGGRNPFKSRDPNRVVAAKSGQMLYVSKGACSVCGGQIKYTKSNSCHFCVIGPHRRQKRNLYYRTPEGKSKARDNQLKTKFGISLDQYNVMLAEQNGFCKICNKTCPSGRDLAVDHDHTTGKVRGLLCKNCNQALGFFFDNTEYLSRAVLYLTENYD